MTTVIANPIQCILRNKRERVEIKLFDKDNDPVDATELSLEVTDLGDNVLYSDDYINPPPGGTRIVRADVGHYYILWGDNTAPANTPTQTETNRVGKCLFVWCITGPAGTAPTNLVQVVKVISSRVASIVPGFRSQIDKTIKATSVDPEDFCPLGYTDSDLLAYLEGGLQLINAYQPYPIFCTLEQFPCEKFGQTLFDAAMLVGINAQTLFAIDTDIENWSDQGNAFVINHHPKLVQFTTTMSQRLDKIIPMMKLHFVSTGSLHIEMGANFRLQTLVSMAPNGALFRNFFSRG